MTVAKNIEITASSTTSFDDALANGISKAAQTINNISGAWIKEQKVTVSDGAVKEYRVTMILTFILSED